ncbi:hypothetical protein ACRALDRAFT_1063967 [Sodiomyces alcalophilus JCM 7366]|uniref:uncharacterized protein n=1 Tax=Sodiomyces alcalophilus JCM 7366 TaxID=591952 RepID=UPI0039B55B42
MSMSALLSWITTSIAPARREDLFLGDASVQDIYAAVKAEADAHLTHRSLDSLNNYRRHVSSPPTTLEKVASWVRQWRLLLRKCNDLGYIARPLEWAADLFNALRPVYSLWVELAELRDIRGIEAGEICPRDLAADAERSVGLTIASREGEQAARPRRIGHYSVGEAEEEGHDSPAAPPNHGGRNGARQKINRRKRKHDAEETAKCIACGFTDHNLEECWFVFPEQAPAIWRGGGRVGAAVRRVMQVDKDLSAAIEDIRRKKRHKVTHHTSIKVEDLTREEPYQETMVSEQILGFSLGPPDGPEIY